ncbi:unnamed protein product [Brugia timori]|uniref:Uncharacterized protein n=1 Tax=Brugia timori TaxID=42155 RepID=A0A0R3Q9Q3_9BILA|nr:unnamed protein product [Brugia timori]
MSFQQSGLKENIQLSKETTELIESLAVFLRVPLTPSQLLVCVELLQKGVSYRSLIDAIIRYSGKQLSERMRRSKRRRNSELDKDEEKLQIALQDIQKKMKSVIPLKKKVNESLSTLQELVDKNKLSIGCKLSGALRSRVLNLYENAKKACEVEATCVRNLLEDIEKLRKRKYELQRSNLVGRGELMQMLSQSARTAPLWIGPPDTHPPALVGAIPAFVSMSLKVSKILQIIIQFQ